MSEITRLLREARTMRDCQLHCQRRVGEGKMGARGRVINQQVIDPQDSFAGSKPSSNPSLPPDIFV